MLFVFHIPDKFCSFAIKSFQLQIQSFNYKKQDLIQKGSCY